MTGVTAGVTAFAPLHVTGRIRQLATRLGELDVTAGAITDLINIRWLTGFNGSSAVLLVSTTDAKALLITDDRYAEQAPAEIATSGCENTEVAIQRDPTDTDWITDSTRLALEDSITWGEQRRWATAFADSELICLEATVEELRAVKTEAELERIRAAAAIADAALSAVHPKIRPGITEKEIANALDDEMRTQGATGPAYDTIVAGGPNAALPHAHPSDRPFEQGDLVVIDVGAVVDGYRSDMTRTFSLGTPGEQAQKMLDATFDSQAQGVAAVSAGVKARDVDLTCRQALEDVGMGEAFSHSTGHGVGLNIHELPRLTHRSDDILDTANVVTVEPGVYYPGFGGVRIEDLVVVNDAGCEVLTHFHKDPLIPL